MKTKRLAILVLTVLLMFGCFSTMASGATTKLSAPDVAVSNIASSGKIKLTWDKVNNAVAYKVYRATSKNGIYRMLNTVKSTTFTNTSAEAGKTYYYYVIAVDEKGNTSAKSTIVLRKCDLPRPDISLSSVASSGKIKVSWNAIAGAKKYEVYRATSKSGTYSKVYTTTTTSYVNTSATVGKTYYYKVKALASVSSANSAFSSVGYRTCDCARPNVEIGNVASSGKIKLSWNAVTGAKQYAIYRATSNSGTYTLLKRVTRTSFTNTSVEAGKTYYYKVKAEASDSVANSAFSLVAYQTCDLKRPQITVTLNDNGSPKITWTKISGAKEYKIYRSTKENSGFTLLKTVTGTSFTNTSAEKNTKYYYKIRAVAEKSAANSAYSTPKCITTAMQGETLSSKYVYQTSVAIYDAPANEANRWEIPYMTEVKLGSFVRDGVEYGWCRLFYEGDWYYTYISEDLEKFTGTKSTYEYAGETELQQTLIDKALYIHDNWDTYYAHKMSDGVADKNGRYGFDCSGFASYLLDETMLSEVPIYNLSSDIEELYNTWAIYNDGLRGECRAKTIALSNIQPGDVIFFSLNGGGVDHCGVYLGNNEFIQSTEVWDGVCIAPLKGLYGEKHIVKVKRFLPTEILYAKKEMRVNVTYTGLRAKPLDSASITSKFDLAEPVTLLFKAATSSWGYVKTESGQKGYVLMKYLSDSSEFEPLNETRAINVTYTGLRNEPDSDLELSRKLPKGTKVTLLYIGGSWGYVETKDGAKGYVLLQYLD